MKKQYKTACPLNCYDVCGLVVTTENNQIINIDGDIEHPITLGRVCGKGKLLKNRIYNSNRLLYPQKKVGDSFIRISWDEALTEISNKMKLVKAAYGPTAILHSYDYSSGGLLKGLDQRFFNFFGGMTEVIGSLCWGAGIQAQLYDMGDALSHDVSDIKNTKTIVVWGRNVTTTNMHLLPFLIKAKKRGSKLIVIDPVKNGIARQADTHVAVKAGMDGNLALAISKVIVENNWLDMNFINKHTIGFEYFLRVLEEIDVESISREIDVDVNTIQELAAIFSQNRPVMTFLGLGMQRYANGGNTIRAIDALTALSGNIGINGGGVNYANLSVGRSFNWNELLRDELREGYRTFSRATQAREITEGIDPSIKMAFITRSNAVTQLPNMERTISALNSIETKVVIDMHMTETAKMADYLLPTTSVFEEEDIYYGSMFHRVIRYGPKLVEPPGETWSDLKIWTELAKKLQLYGFEKTTEEFLELALKGLNSDGLDLATLKDINQYLLPIETVPWKNKQFATPSKKFEFYSEKAKGDGLPPVASIAYPKESSKNKQVLKEKYPFNLLSIHPVKSLHSQHSFLLLKSEITPWIIISESIAVLYSIIDGDKIKVFNDRGEVTGRAKVQQGNNPDTIVIEEGWCKESGANANILTLDELSDMGNGSIQYDCAVMIAKS